jgi:YNFM family putative membrane transporter
VNPSVIPVVLAGICAFLTLFAPQPILPMLADVFHASKVTISLMVTASTLGVALAAPVIG